jgi:hypothetical protein
MKEMFAGTIPDTAVIAGETVNIKISIWAGQLDDQGSSPGRGWEFFSFTPCPDWLWGPSSLLSNGYQWLFPWG